MATNPDDIEDIDPPADEQPDQTPEDQQPIEDEAQPAEDGEEETVIELDDDLEAEPETATIRRMREAIREKDRKIAELSKVSAPAQIEAGPKPTLESCEWDEDKFERELDAWKGREAASEQQKTQAQQAQQAAAQEFQRKHAEYLARAAALPVQGYKEAEDAVVAALPMPMQEALVRYFPDAEKIVLALGKHPAQLEKIAAITDPVAQLLALKDFGGKVKMTVKRRAPEPETIPSGGAPIVGTSVEKQLEKLEKDAERTGDRSKLIAFKAQQRQNGGK